MPGGVAYLHDMNVRNAPIGIFDSGLGGLSVAIEVNRRLPNERLLYAADSRYCPYGNRTPEEIRWRTLLMTGALIERGVKALIIACNTATAVVLEELRDRFPVPIIGLEPAVKPAIELSRSDRIAVLATPRTAASERLQRLIQRYAGARDVVIVPGFGLVEVVEAGAADDQIAVETLRPLIAPLLDSGVDALVLGCTHYPFLKPAIRTIAGDTLALVDSGEAIARRTEFVLDLDGRRTERTIPGGIELMTTGDIAHVSWVASRLLSRPIAADLLSFAGEAQSAALELFSSTATCTDSVSGGA